MKASNFSDAQKALILKQGDDGMSVAEIYHKRACGHRGESIGNPATLR